MTPRRFQVCYYPRAKMESAARDKGWTENGPVGLLDVLTNFETFEEVYSENPTLAEAAAVAKRLVSEDRDFFGQATVEEQEYLLVVPEDNYRLWETVATHSVDETGLVETVRWEIDA